MSWLERLLGTGGGNRANERGSSAAVRAIAERLDNLPAETARYLAAFASVLARVAEADLRIDHDEKAAMCDRVATLARIEPGDAELIVELASRRLSEHGGGDRYLVTREFKEISSREQRIHLVECLFAIAAADGEISTTESHESLAIAEELGLTRSEALSLRAQWRDHLAELKKR